MEKLNENENEVEVMELDVQEEVAPKKKFTVRVAEVVAAKANNYLMKQEEEALKPKEAKKKLPIAAKVIGGVAIIGVVGGALLKAGAELASGQDVPELDFTELEPDNGSSEEE